MVEPNNANGTKICYKFEIGLKEPSEKNKIRANIFLIFARQDIQDEEVMSISYVKNESQVNLYDSIIIRITSKTAADKMIECLSNVEKLNEVGFSKYNLQEEENFEFMQAGDADYNGNRSLSMSSVLTDGILVYPENENNLSTYFKNETSFYLPKPKATSSEKSNTTMSTLSDEEVDTNNNNNSTVNTNELEMQKSLKADENEDTRVEFYSNKPILDKDLNNVMLFVENRKASGGGDTLTHVLDDSRRFLLVQYETMSSKKRVLEKMVHKFERFTLNANLPFDKSKFEVNPIVVILRGVTADTTEHILQLYTENLVVNDDDTNDVLRIERSKLLQGVVYVTFKKPIDEEKIKYRINKKPKLNDSAISYMKAYTTNISVVRAPLANDDGRVLVETYFCDKNRCGSQPFASSQFQKPFVFLVYNNEQDCLGVLAKEHSLDNQPLKAEYLYNFELFKSSEEIVEVVEEVEEEEEEEEENKIETSQSQSSRSEQDRTMKEDEEEEIISTPNVTNNENVVVDLKVEIKDESKEDETTNVNVTPTPVIAKQTQAPPTLNLSITQEPKLRIFKELPSAFEQFENELKDRHALFQIMLDDGSIQIVCVREMADSDYAQLTSQWTSEILKYLKEFFNQFELSYIPIENPDDIFPLPACIKMDPDRCRTSLIAPPGQPIQLELMGYKEDVEDLKFQIKIKLDANAIVSDRLVNLTLTKVRILFINKYDVEMKTRFENLTCKANDKELCVEYSGPRRDVEEAKKCAQDLLDSVVKHTMPVDSLVVRFFIEKEKRIVKWILQTLKIKCVVEPNPDMSTLEIYSTNRAQINELCKAIKVEFSPITIDQSLIDLINEKAFNDFMNQLNEEEDLVYAMSTEGLKLCTFKDNSDLIYTKFLEELPKD